VCPNSEWRFPTFGATRVPVSRSKGRRSRSPCPLMLTHMVRHIFRTARPTNFKLGLRMEDDDPHQRQAPWTPRSKVKVARSRDQSEPSWPNDVPVSWEAGGGIPCRPNPAAAILLVKNTVVIDFLYSFESLLSSTWDSVCECSMLLHHPVFNADYTSQLLPSAAILCFVS